MCSRRTFFRGCVAALCGLALKARDVFKTEVAVSGLNGPSPTSYISAEQLKAAFEEAGKRVGLGTIRPPKRSRYAYGRIV